MLTAIITIRGIATFHICNVFSSAILEVLIYWWLWRLLLLLPCTHHWIVTLRSSHLLHWHLLLVTHHWWLTPLRHLIHYVWILRTSRNMLHLVWLGHVHLLTHILLLRYLLIHCLSNRSSHHLWWILLLHLMLLWGILRYLISFLILCLLCLSSHCISLLAFLFLLVN